MGTQLSVGKGSTEAVLERFARAWEAWDLEAVMDCLADDAVFESTDPAPDGRRLVGRTAIRELWEPLFRDTPEPEFRFEESFVSGDRGTARWRFSWANPDGSRGRVRGCDVLRVRDGQVVEKLSYVKG